MTTDQGRPPELRERRRLTPSERVTGYGYVIGGLFTMALAFDADLYRREGRPVLVGGGLVLVVLGAVVFLRRKETTTQTLVQSTSTIGVSVACANFMVSPIMGTATAAAVGMLTLGIAARCSPRQTYAVMALAALGGLLVVTRTGAGPSVLVGVAALTVSVSTVPAMMTLYYRRQLEEALDRVQVLATTDALTGLVNRRGLQDVVPLLLATAERSGRLIGVLMVDVDHFKQFNDRFGHLAGDEALRSVAGVVRGAVRQTDLVARFGGEEFCVVAVVERAEELEALGERIRKNVEADQGCGVTVSLGGYSGLPASDLPAGELFWSMVALADEQLYAAKAGGRNATRVRAAEPEPADPSAGRAG